MNAPFCRDEQRSVSPWAESPAYPLYVTAAITLRCNYRCAMCYQTQYKGDIDPVVVEKLKDILPQAKSFRVYGGEPLISKELDGMMRMSKDYGCDLSFISNGSRLDEAMCARIVEFGVKHIKFSIDAGTPGTYKKIRGGDFDAVIASIARISRIKRQSGVEDPDMHVNFLAMRSNVHELPGLVRLAREIGVSGVNVFYPSINKAELFDECVYFDQKRSDESLALAKEVADSLGMYIRLPILFRDSAQVEQSGERGACRDPWEMLLLNIDGEAFPCCGGAPSIGNLARDDFEAIWNGERVNDLRRRVNTPDRPDCCRNCRVKHAIPTELELHIPDPNLRAQAQARVKGGAPGA